MSRMRGLSQGDFSTASLNLVQLLLSISQEEEKALCFDYNILLLKIKL